MVTLYLQQFFTALVFTDAVELAVLFLMLRIVFRATKEMIDTKSIIFSGLFASCATLPYVWFVFFPLIQHQSRTLAMVISETTVVVIEGIFYFFMLKLSPKKAFLCSLVCNMVSFVGGLIFLF